MVATGAIYKLLATNFPTSNASFLGGYQTDALSLALPHDGGGDGWSGMPQQYGAIATLWRLKRFPLIMVMRGTKGEV